MRSTVLLRNSEPRAFTLAVFCMCVAVLAANILVQHPFTPFGLADYLTWGAFTYPVTFLVNDLTNRRLGPERTRRVIYAGFALAVVLSAAFATPRIALASGSAFLVAQLLDCAVFNRLRRQAWWLPPLMSGFVSSAVDTALFFSLAFAGTDLPWQSWALCDYAVKLVMIGVFLGPYRMLIARMPAWQPTGLRA